MNKFIINNLLLVFGLMMIISGFAIQFGFHVGGSDAHHGVEHEDVFQNVEYEQMREIDPNKTIWGLSYSNWSATHKVVIVVFSLLMIYHIYEHWKWYKGVITKHLIGKNLQVLILTVLFLLVAITGLVPWFIDLSGSSGLLRMLFIELHDKLAIILVVFLVLHLIKRMKWYASAYKKIK